MKNYNFKFAGIALSDFCGVTTSRPPREVAQYDFTLLDIPGRSGSEYIDNKRYKNAPMIREIGFAQHPYAHIDDLVEKIIDWLAYSQGYQEFEDSDNPGMVTYAVLTNFAEVQTILRRYHKATLKFSRVPFWYDKTALNAQSLDLTPSTPSIMFNNPFKMYSQPIITIQTTSGAPTNIKFELTHNGVTSEYAYANVSGNVTLIFDCVEGVLKVISGNSTVYKNNDIPDRFDIGSTTFRLTLGKSRISAVTIAPRWRCL